MSDVPTPAEGSSHDICPTAATALADAGAAVLRALAASDVEQRRRHITIARQLLTIANDAERGDAGPEPVRPPADPSP